MRKLDCLTTLGVALVICAAAQAQTFTNLVSFNGANGAGPGYLSLSQGLNGSLYGTTLLGGSSGDGTAFRINQANGFISLTSDLNGGEQPISGVIMAPNGEFFGTTYVGGSHGAGEVFKMNAAGAVTDIYGFCPSPDTNCQDGENPFGGLVLATNGLLYGTTTFGGANNGGTIFSITQAGSHTTLYNFCSQPSCADGSSPEGALMQATNGRIYGVTYSDGANRSGTIFQITTGGAFSTIHQFCSLANCADGDLPIGGLIQGLDGNLYGTTQLGGINESGAVYKINPSTGVLTTLYSFCAQPYCTDGAYPFGALVQGTDGNFYGTTEGGGAANAGGSYSLTAGTVFKLTPQGALTTLYSFCTVSGCPDGFDPEGALTQSTNGNFYGTTCGGTCGAGGPGEGTVFEIATGLRPFVKLLPAIGQAGQQMRILGSNLAGATSVTFNGVSATFTVNAATYITATVPSGATTGRVTVATPRGTFASNVPFHVE